MVSVLSVVGKSGAGKTTLIEKLLPELRGRGYRVAVVKHHAHASPIDGPGKDSWRYAEAGADAVVVSSPREVARFERVSQERSLPELVARAGDVDLVLTEGFARESAPKIEVSRAALTTERIARGDELLAMVADYPTGLAVPQFGLEDVRALADWIVARFLRGNSAELRGTQGNSGEL